MAAFIPLSRESAGDYDEGSIKDPSLHRPRTPLLRTLGAAVLVGLFLAGRVSESLHFVLVQHALCEAHGEWVEHGAHHDEGHEESPSEEARWRAHPEAGEHAHCSFVLLKREDVGLPDAPRSSSFAGSTSVRRSPPPVSAPAEAVPRILLAPKNSPPRAA